MGTLKKIRAFIKKKSPATFNAAEYETERILNRIQENEADSAELQKKVENIDQKMREILQQLNSISKRLEANLCASNNGNTSAGRSDIEKELLALASCKPVDNFDRRLIPINKHFYNNNKGIAIAMHLTSVAEKPDPIIYDTPDMIRTGTLSLISDEINSRNLPGSVAELGVAQGKFARVINALFPEKELHLFDTFEGFPKSDIADDKQRNFSDTKSEWYADIDMSALMSSMRYPERCIIHRGYFPDTAVGMEEERFCFVSIDCDLYKPILAGLEFFYPRLVKGGYIFVHDYRSKYFTGVRSALNEFAQKNNISYCVIPDNTGTAVITK